MRRLNKSVVGRIVFYAALLTLMVLFTAWYLRPFEESTGGSASHGGPEQQIGAPPASQTPVHGYDRGRRTDGGRG